MDENTTPTPDVQEIPKDSLEASKLITDALGDSVVPDRIRAREPQAEVAAPPAPAEPEVQPEQAEPALVPEPVSETVTPTEVEAPAEETTYEEEPQEYIPPVQQAPIIDPKAFADENGYVDVNKLTDAINSAISGVQQTASATAQRELAAQKQEERLWNQAIDKYPQLKTDRTLRDFVQQARIGKTTEAYRTASDPTQVRIPTPTQMATELFKRIGQAKSEGVKAATETTEVVTNVLPTSSPAAPTTSNREQLFNKIRDPRDRIGAEKAQTELLKDLLFNNQ